LKKVKSKIEQTINNIQDHGFAKTIGGGQDQQALGLVQGYVIIKLVKKLGNYQSGQLHGYITMARAKLGFLGPKPTSLHFSPNLG
jgi:hypothetical protein